MKKLCILFFFSFILCNIISAQWSVGGRFGGTSGVTIKHYPASSGLLFEGIAAYNFDDHLDAFSVTLLLEKLGALNSQGTLGAIIGGGETMVFGDEFYLGINGILGFDWRIGRIGLQVDWMPTYIFINESYFSPINLAFTARWVFQR